MVGRIFTDYNAGFVFDFDRSLGILKPIRAAGAGVISLVTFADASCFHRRNQRCGVMNVAGRRCNDIFLIGFSSVVFNLLTGLFLLVLYYT